MATDADTAEPTYEMLWDCSACGTKALLGVSHRRCPNCGAPQDPTTRYFPKPGTEVLAQNHLYAGADWRCAACTTPNSKRALFCVNCGNPQAEGNAAVGVQAARKVVDGAVAPTDVAAPAGRPRWVWVAGALVVAVVAFVLVAVFWQRPTAVVVDAHAWRREIEVERFLARADSAWCDQMPADAYGVSRSREVRSHRQIPDGEDCHTVQHDNGDGSFSNQQVCTPRMRSEPEYSDKCRYTVNRWRTDRTETAAGVGTSPAPAWPALRLRAGTCLGCEREGARREELTVELRAQRNPARRYTCTLDDARWPAVADGAHGTVNVRVVGGGAVCGSLKL